MRWLFLFIVCAVAMVVAQEAEEDDAKTGDLLSPYEYFDTDGIVEAMKAEFKRRNWRRFFDCLNLVMKHALKENKENEMVERSEKVYMPLLQFCRAMLESLPQEGLEIYRATYSALAERELKKALERGDEEAMRRVALIYPMTDAASKALELVADGSLERGDVGIAYSYLQESGRGGAVLLKQAAALLIQGDKAEAAALLKAAKKAGVQSRFPLATELLEKELATESEPEEMKKPNLVMGLTAGVADSMTSLDFAAVSKVTYKYENNTRYGVDWDEKLQPLLTRHRNRQRIPIGPWGRRTRTYKTYTGPFNSFAVVLDGKVCIVDSAYVYVRKLKGGKLEWRYPELGGTAEVNVLVRMPSCDDKFLYAVVASNRRITTGVRGPRRWRVPVSAQANDLLAFPLRGVNNAEVAWSAYNKNSARLRKTLFLTPPLAVNGRVYVGCATALKQSQWDYGVACFSRSGHLLWLSNFAFNKNLCVTGGILSAYDGKIYYLTNGGLLACLDERTGRVEWVVRYAVTPLEGGGGSEGYPPVAPLFWKGVWKGRSRRVIVILPSDSDYVSAYDLDAKRLLWREERSGATSMLGFYKDCVILTGGQSLFRTGKPAIIAYHIITGKIRLHDEAGRQSMARGLLSKDGHLLLPCADGLWMLKIEQHPKLKDAYTTKEVGFWRWHERGGRGLPVGNLLLYGRRLICVNSSRCCVYLLPQR